LLEIDLIVEERLNALLKEIEKQSEFKPTNPVRGGWGGASIPVEKHISSSSSSSSISVEKEIEIKIEEVPW